MTFLQMNKRYKSLDMYIIISRFGLIDITWKIDIALMSIILKVKNTNPSEVIKKEALKIKS